MGRALGVLAPGSRQIKDSSESMRHLASRAGPPTRSTDERPDVVVWEAPMTATPARRRRPAATRSRGVGYPGLASIRPGLSYPRSTVARDDWFPDSPDH